MVLEVFMMNTTAIKGLLGVFVVLFAATMALFVGALVEQSQSWPAPAVMAPVVTTAAVAQPAYIGEARAIALAKSAVSGTLIEVEFDDVNRVYEVEIDDGGTETGVTIDALTGKVLGTETEVDASTVGPRPISEEEAIAIARQVVKSGTLAEVELESETGVLVYAVEFIDGDRETEVLVSMDTGAVIGIEHESADDDDD
jgi:uncharacterized membrane protein YkoI